MKIEFSEIKDKLINDYPDELMTVSDDEAFFEILKDKKLLVTITNPACNVIYKLCALGLVLPDIDALREYVPEITEQTQYSCLYNSVSGNFVCTYHNPKYCVVATTFKMNNEK